MAIIPLGNRHSWLVGLLLSAAWFGGGLMRADETPRLFDSVERIPVVEAIANPASEAASSAQAVVRGQTPYGYGYPHDGHDHFTSHPMTFADASSPWITAQPVAGPAPRYGSPQIAQAPLDPFMAPNMYGVPGGYNPGMPGYYNNVPAVWQPYVAGQGIFGNERTQGIGQFMMPLLQNGESLLFADIRGRYDDNGSYEGNFGLAYRKLVDPTWFIGVYGFYDYMHSTYGNNFNQVTAGLEAMSVKWEARINGYLPESGTKAANQLTTAEVVGGNIVVNGGFEKAYYGMDAEIGVLIWEALQGNFELRGFAGGFYFDASGANFPEVAGPKGRLEMRLYDCPWFGPESRLTLGVEVQNDSVRDFQYAGLARLEIPLNFFQTQRRLTRLERRMLDRIVRDDDVVTVARQGAREQAKDALTNRPLTNVTLLDANHLPGGLVNAVATGTSTVVLDGAAGPVSGNSVVVANGQVFRGGGFQIVGMDSGATTTYGVRPTINNNVAGTTAVLLQDGATVADLNINGGAAGVGSVGAAARDGLLVSGINVSNATTAGFNFAGVGPNSTFQNNTATQNPIGFSFAGPFDGTFRNNKAQSNTSLGFQFAGTVGQTGLIDGNSAINNNGGGFRFNGNVAGTVSQNSADGNLGDGFRFDSSLLATGLVTGNSSTGNGMNANGTPATNANGFTFTGPVLGDVTNNTAARNTVFGYSFGNLNAGSLVSGNSADRNVFSGFSMNGTLAGDVTNNTSTNNGYLNNLAVYPFADGFTLLNPITGTFTGNTAQGNFNNGFAGPLDTNFTNNGTFSTNIANNNGDFGFRAVNNGIATGNTAAGNANSNAVP